MSRSWLVLLVLNLAFVALRLADNAVDKPSVAAALRTAFLGGGFDQTVYSVNPLEGFDRYSDCITAQVAVLGDRSWLRDALAPRIVSPEQVGPDLQVQPRNTCVELKSFVEGTLGFEPSATYVRFWHGAASAFTAALLVMPVDGYRALLLTLTLGLIALCAIFAALVRQGLLVALAPILGVSFLFGGQVGYGQLISYGPAMICAWLLAAIVVGRADRWSSDALVTLAVTAGALEAFFDQIISVPLAASIVLIASGLACVPRWLEQGVKTALADGAAYGAAWLFGFGGSSAIKLALSVAVVGPDAYQSFVDQFAFRTGLIDPGVGLLSDQGSRIETAAKAGLPLAANLWRLFYVGHSGSAPVIATGLAVLAGGLGWCVALLEAIRAYRGRCGVTFLIGGAPYLAAALFLAVWVVALPEHTVRHAFFMVRATVVWLCGGWGIVLGARYAAGLAGRSDPPASLGRAAGRRDE